MEVNYRGKKIAILGFGIEGQSAFRWLKSQGATDIVIHDVNESVTVPHGVKAVLGEQYLAGLDAYGLIFRSPGVLPTTFKTSVPVTSVMNEFLAHAPGTIIGVTGS